MSNTTVAQFAAELNHPVNDLPKQSRGAGVNKNSGNGSPTTDDKQLLTAYLQKKNGSSSGTIGVRRKKTEVNAVDGIKAGAHRRSHATTIPSSKESATEAKAKVVVENQKAEAGKATAKVVEEKAKAAEEKAKTTEEKVKAGTKATTKAEARTKAEAEAARLKATKAIPKAESKPAEAKREEIKPVEAVEAKVEVKAGTKPPEKSVETEKSAEAEKLARAKQDRGGRGKEVKKVARPTALAVP